MKFDCPVSYARLYKRLSYAIWAFWESQIMRRYALSIAAGLLLLNVSPLRAQDEISVMTQNQFLGGLQEVFSFVCVDLSGPSPGEGCEDPFIVGAFNDHLTLTLDALVDRI